MNSANISLENLSEKIRQYLSGDVPHKPLYLHELKSRLQLAFDGRLSHIPDPDFEAAYKNARNLALELRLKYPAFPKLPPPCNSNPITGLQDLLEWCIDNSYLQQQADFFEKEEAKKGKGGFRKKTPEELSE